MEQRLFDLQIIFYDPIVDYRELPILAYVGMGVYIVRLPMGRPSGMANAHLPRQRLPGSQGLPENAKASSAFFYLQPSVRRYHRDSG